MQSTESSVDRLIALAEETAGTAWPLLVQGYYNRALTTIITVWAVFLLFLIALIVMFWVTNKINYYDPTGALIDRRPLIAAGSACAIVLLITIQQTYINLPTLLNPQAATALRLLGM